ncbi:MAG: 3-deoxy-D-manno-octulosonic acid transferase [Desulfobulbaceae bacterium]|nr:3-deoxy-D-manno-octulosonic acid transferase [Desulfobulbaceae bacterium]HIJ79090.1 3-deoxy-D-manno-octulosonic acid transferase [Deltaproteobacteria bacterium]
MVVRFFYNLLQMIGLIVFAPIIFVKVILTPKYRSRVPARLGLGLDRLALDKFSGRPRLWLHALSVGEVASARYLVKELRRAHPEAAIFFSSATRAGEHFARETLTGQVDLFVPFPLDLGWSVQRIVTAVKPDLFVLVETDFWPNMLACLKKHNIPALLVNGRISAESLARYRSLNWFFLPLFQSFSHLAMQTERDALNLIELGVAGQRVSVLGNLKYDAVVPAVRAGSEPAGRAVYAIPDQALVWVAGSTHQGEEEVILAAFARLVAVYPDLFLVLAPRNVERGTELQLLAREAGFSVRRWTEENSQNDARVLVLDTLGKLAGLYALCDFAYVGGSLVPERGHNPLEPAVFGKPVMFGPHMEDFEEISRDLLKVGGAREVKGEDEIFACVSGWLSDNNERERVGAQGRQLVLRQQGVTQRHLALIDDILARREL